MKQHDAALRLGPDFEAKAVDGTFQLCFLGKPVRTLTPGTYHLLHLCEQGTLRTDIPADQLPCIDLLIELGVVHEFSGAEPTIGPTPTVLVVSPHMDDAFLSIGGTLLQWRNRYNVRVLDVFGEDPWCTYHERFRLTARQLIQVRRREEAFNGLRVGCDIWFGQFPSAPSRGYSVWDQAVDLVRDAPVMEEIAQEIESAIDDACELLLFPMGIGGHTDHRLIAAIGSRFLLSEQQPSGLSVILYEDLPYAADGRAWHACAIPLHHIAPLYHPIDASLAAKRQIVSVYQSQLVPDEGYRILAYSQSRNMHTGIPEVDTLHAVHQLPDDSHNERLWCNRLQVEGLRSRVVGVAFV